jgi:hypothetical protein|tara:strand:- start:308 stop:523 length:216 start_codon:yes stop_codon:yes gene_type:complete
MRPLIEYYETANDVVVSAVKKVDWKRTGKISIIIIPALLWTPFYIILGYVYKGSTWVNEAGGNLIEEFLND